MFGPVGFDDLCWWLPVVKTAAKKAVNILGMRIVSFEYAGRECLMDVEAYEEFLSFKPVESEPVVNFLPYEDHFAKAYINRKWYISCSAAEMISPRERKTDFGQIRPSIWLNGEIIGRWELEWADKKKSAMKVKIVGYKKDVSLSIELSNLIEDQKNLLEQFLNDKLVPIM
jgi:hypothetical protein